MEVYDQSIFTFEDNFLIVTFPFAEGFTLPHGNVNGNVNVSGNGTEAIILDCIRQNPKFTLDKIAECTGFSKRTISRQMKTFQEAGTVKRIGSPKTGYWEVLQDEG